MLSQPIEIHIVPEDVSEVRFSDYACGIFEALPTRKSVKKAIKSGLLKIDGKEAETGRWMISGMQIELYREEQSPQKILPVKLNVVYEDDYLAVVHKPPGISVSGNYFYTIEHSLPYNLKVCDLPTALAHPLPVHRLDNPTEGLLLVAKERIARIELGKMFEEKSIQKTYQALAMGFVPDEGIMDFPIENQKSVTVYKTRERCHSLRNGFLSLVELKPQTGRTHQIRIHLSTLGFPILGDKLYGTKGNVLLKNGLFLFASGLEFIHPVSCEYMTLGLPVPDSYFKRMENEERRWKKYHSI